MRRFARWVAVASLALTSVVVSAAAASAPIGRFVLPGDCVYPEGIAVQRGKYYVGSTCNGQLYRGDPDRRRAEVFVPADPTPFEVVGIDATDTRLVAARGKGFATVWNRYTGKRIAQFSNGRGYDSNVNDVIVAPDGDAYLTDFVLSKIYRIPAAKIAHRKPGVQKLRVFLNLRGTAFPVQEGSANGIVATPGGRFLIVAHFSEGRLYRVRISNGDVDRIRLHGKTLAGPDGIALRGRVLYAVEFAKQRVAKIRLRDHYSRGRIVSRTSSPRFQCPTGVDVARGRNRLFVVNSQFCGPGEPPFTVANIPLP